MSSLGDPGSWPEATSRGDTDVQKAQAGRKNARFYKAKPRPEWQTAFGSSQPSTPRWLEAPSYGMNKPLNKTDCPGRTLTSPVIPHNPTGRPLQPGSGQGERGTGRRLGNHEQKRWRLCSRPRHTSEPHSAHVCTPTERQPSPSSDSWTKDGHLSKTVLAWPADVSEACQTALLGISAETQRKVMVGTEGPRAEAMMLAPQPSMDQKRRGRE